MKNIYKNKSAQGHIEMMLSFVLFVSAILFIFFYINPFSSNKENYEIDNIQLKIMKNITAVIGKLSVVSFNSCYNITSEDYSKENYYETLEPDFAGLNKKYTIYFSNIFSNYYPNNNPSCINSDYKLGIFSNESIISYDLLKIMVDKCKDKNEYNNLRKNLGIKTNFMIHVSDLNNNLIADLSFDKDISKGVEAEAREFPVKIIKNDGKIIETLFNLRIW